MLRAVLIALAFAAALPAAAADSARLELLMVERAGCPWCQRFDREIAPIYGRTEFGGEAPLRRASLDDGQPRSAELDEPVRFTPTFVLLKGGREIGRIVGYSDNATFFGLLEKLIADKAPRP